MDSLGIKLNIYKINIINFLDKIIEFYSSSVKISGINIIIQNELKRKLEKNEIIANIIKLNKENEYDYTKALFLIVDDDKNVRKIITEYLILNGYKNFILAPNGKISLSAVNQFNPNIIICDYNMPDLSGDKLHNVIMSIPKYKKTPFIFLSAISNSDIIYERKLHGADAFLTKPINEKDLIITIENNLKKYFDYLKIANRQT